MSICWRFQSMVSWPYCFEPIIYSEENIVIHLMSEVQRREQVVGQGLTTPFNRILNDLTTSPLAPPLKSYTPSQKHQVFT